MTTRGVCVQNVTYGCRWPGVLHPSPTPARVWIAESTGDPTAKGGHAAVVDCQPALRLQTTHRSQPANSRLLVARAT